MPAFPKPAFDFAYDPAVEIAHLRTWRDTAPGRKVPRKHPKRVLVGSWNIANLGVQERRAQDYALIAELIGWFDVIALQEVNENTTGLEALRAALPRKYKLVYSDAAGNNERMSFIYDADKIDLLEEIGEIAFAPSEYDRIKLPGVAQTFDGFDRTPYFVSLRAQQFTFQLANVHLYYGSFRNAEESKRSMNRRALETFAVATWAADRRRSKHTAIKDIVVLGDFNLPKSQPGDPIFDALTKKGLKLPEHTSQVGSNLEGDMYYDQIGFFADETGEFTGSINVFDFDGAVFPELWQTRSRNDFRAYVRYYLSDHRPIWCEFSTAL